ncbi:glycosyl hydrolase family 18 protein [Streptomyces noboritoensis]|uniref:Glycosyl hydrolase family 18 protein n=1 Tax=Streptomyces noboritoensis TaxID=67337 RepID=A0ABV6TCM3_9ACTN
MIYSGRKTYDKGAELDYMVARNASAGYTATALNSMYGSDHHPVIFSTGAVDPGPCPAPVRTPRQGALAAENADDACPSTDKPAAVVSMGDSYISGEGGRWAGNANTSPSGDVWGTDRRALCLGGEDCIYGKTSYDGGNGCDRSDVAPINTADMPDVPPERRFNIACSGAETKHIVSESFQGEKPQAEQLAELAEDNDVKLIVVSIGGNDIGFSKVVEACVRRYWTGFSVGVEGAYCNDSGKEEDFARKVDDAQTKVTDALKKVRSVMQEAGYADDDYDLVLSTYPNALPKSVDERYDDDDNKYAAGGCPFRSPDLNWARDSAMPRVTTMLRQAASAADASVLDVSDAFTGHELCNKNAKQAVRSNSVINPLAESEAEWVRWVPYLFDTSKGWLWGSQGHKQEAIHPNAFGQKALGTCLAAFVAAQEETPGRARTSTCTGTPGKGGDGIGLRRTVQIRKVPRGPIAGNTGVLQRYEPDSKWVSTGPDDGQLGRWFINGELPAPGEQLATTIKNGSGQYLQGDGGRSWQWASVSDSPRVWTIERQRSNEPVFRISTEGGKWCLTPREIYWAALWPCGAGGPLNTQLWQIDTATIKITPRDTEFKRNTGLLKSAKDGFVADVDNADPAPGTRVKALAPHDSPAQKWTMRRSPEGWQIVSTLEGHPALAHDTGRHEARLAEAKDGDKDQLWQVQDAGDGWAVIRNGESCLTAGDADATLTVGTCDPKRDDQRWKAPGVTPDKPDPQEPRTGWVKGLDGKCLEVKDGNDTNGTPVRLADCARTAAQTWKHTDSGTVEALGKCLDADHSGKDYGTKAQLWDCNGSTAQQWKATDGKELKNVNADLCLDVPSSVSTDGRQLQLWGCNGSDAQKWVFTEPTGEDKPKDGDAGDPFDDSADDRGTKPAASGDCRPEGMTPTRGVSARYCDVYDGAGREWVGKDRTRRMVGYFTGWRAGTNGDPKYLVSNIPWSKVSHINYAFARVDNDRISIGDPSDAKNPATAMTWDGAKNAMDPSLPYKGHFNLLNTYKKKHPAVKTLISVGGWADTRNFYAMATNADGSVNQAGIDTFADSVTEFLDRYGFNGVDIDYEYPTALPNTGNPKDWDVSNPRRKGLQQGYNALMKTLREKLDKAGADKGRYYLLTSAGSSSGYLVRGQDAGQALQYQDFVNVMSYDLHGSWNKFVGPQAPLYDDGKDNELADAGIYNDQAANTKDFQKHGYFNVDWSYHYYRGALPPGRINLGIPYYSRGWRDVQGGSDGLWGTAAMPDQSQCPQGTGGRGPANAQSCGLGAVGIDNVWHDTEDGREVGAGSNPLWHTKNLQDGLTPGYLGSYGVKDTTLTGTYAEKYSDALKAPWLWNDAKKVFLSTENERSVDAKAKYIADKDIGGAMVWELAGDYTKRAGGEWGMGYDLTTRLDNAFKGAGAYGNAKAGGRAQPREVIDVKAELVDFPTGKDDFYPVQPKLRITNDSKVTLGRGTEISFDIPTSTPPVVKDNDYKEMKGLTPGHTGPNAGGLKGDFHRLTLKLGYCEDLPPGKYRDIDLKYYLPITGPANVTFKVGDKEFGSTGDRRRDVTVVDPPAPASSDRCQAADYTKGQVYRPDGGRLWRMYDKGDKGWMFEYGDSPSGQPMMIDNNPDQSRVHLVELGESNPNQYWRIRPAGDGLYTIVGGDRCMTVTDSRKDIGSIGCDGRAEQKWKLVPIADNGSESAPAGPRHNGLFKLRSATGDHDMEVANGTTARETHIVSGDPAASTAAFVKHDGWYWYAQWYTTVAPGQAESNGGKPWKKLGPAA